ncbi:hypothetical protein BP6252_06111 [Coleophoma cylindrospora]|uniref:Uncharacterized protein n=1 Tax=Coleophoma cylindrospora TaxID=1849047 RepID=A0A3D8RLQ7_9HELO|nr:hypothetical protein BP6252_06111 [Coleophoma cylindrospora]
MAAGWLCLQSMTWPEKGRTGVRDTSCFRAQTDDHGRKATATAVRDADVVARGGSYTGTAGQPQSLRDHGAPDAQMLHPHLAYAEMTSAAPFFSVLKARGSKQSAGGQMTILEEQRDQQHLHFE